MQRRRSYDAEQFQGVSESRPEGGDPPDAAAHKARLALHEMNNPLQCGSCGLAEGRRAVYGGVVLIDCPTWAGKQSDDSPACPAHTGRVLR